MTDTSSLRAFIEARLDEEQQAALPLREPDVSWRPGIVYGTVMIEGGPTFVHTLNAALAEHIARYEPARALREVAAKRAILQAAAEYSPELEHGDNGEWALDLTLRALASVHADHPDYRTSWAPETVIPGS